VWFKIERGGKRGERREELGKSTWRRERKIGKCAILQKSFHLGRQDGTLWRAELRKERTHSCCSPAADWESLVSSREPPQDSLTPSVCGEGRVWGWKQSEQRMNDLQQVGY
jgi:hypothetical protein